MNPPFSNTTYQRALSDLIARSAMSLPPLTGERGATFVRSMLSLGILMFWEEYIEHLDPEAKSALLHLDDTDAREPAEAWYQRYANFKDDPEARARAERAMHNLKESFPKVIEEEWQTLSSQKS